MIGWSDPVIHNWSDPVIFTDVAGKQELADFEATIFEGRGHFLMQEAAEELTGSIIDHALEILAAEPARDGSS